MASSLRHVASPRSISSALNITPKLQVRARQNVRHSLFEELLSPHSTPSNSPYSSVPPALSPEVSSILEQRFQSPSVKNAISVTREGVQKLKSVRKLPWNDVINVGSHVNDERCNSETLAEPLPLPYLHKALKHDDYTKLPSVNTPDRKEFTKKMQRGLGYRNILGKGSFGTVLEATYKGKVVAVKVVSCDSECSKQLESEANALQLNHQNIVRVLKVVLPTHELNGMVIMARVTGFSLQNILDMHPFKITSYLRIRYSLEVSHGLQYCHSQGILHLDIKPKNILIDALTNACKLCDFGSSTRIGARVTLCPKGTVGYTAPELLCGCEPTTAADVYSLGLTMWQIMSGENPYNGYGEHTIIYKVVSTQYRPTLPAVETQDDKIFIELFMNCWAHVPENRPSLQLLISQLMDAQKSDKFILPDTD